MKTNKKILSLLGACMIAIPALAQDQANLRSDPAYLPIDQLLDLQKFKPEVNINLPRFLLLDAASEFDGGANDPLAKAGINFKELVSDIKLIRLLVIQANTETRADLEKAVASLKKQVEATWTPIISVPEDNVGIYMLGDASGERAAGLALLVCDNGNAVIANVVGHVSIGKILKIATQSNALPKDLLGKLSDFTGKGPKTPASGPPKEEPKKSTPKPEKSAQ